MAKENKKIIQHRKYMVEVIDYDDGEIVINRTNDGFAIIELLGLLSMIQNDLFILLKGVIKVPEENIHRTSTNSPVIHSRKRKKQ